MIASLAGSDDFRRKVFEPRETRSCIHVLVDKFYSDMEKSREDTEQQQQHNEAAKSPEDMKDTEQQQQQHPLLILGEVFCLYYPVTVGTYLAMKYVYILK